MNTQVTLFQLDNYGPWTVTPEPKREPDLQSLQARLYADICDFVGSHNGYTFSNRFDNMIAVTNGIREQAHVQLQESVRNRYPVTVSAAIATDSSPSAALADATEALQETGSAQDKTRRNVLANKTPDRNNSSTQNVCIAHFDIISATKKFTDNLNAFEASIRIKKTYMVLAEHLYQEYSSLSFFMGGDNIIAVCPTLVPDQFRAVLHHISEESGVELQVGVGTGQTAVSAGQEAKVALETCRTREQTLAYRGKIPPDQRSSATSST